MNPTDHPIKVLRASLESATPEQKDQINRAIVHLNRLAEMIRPRFGNVGRPFDHTSDEVAPLIKAVVPTPQLAKSFRQLRGAIYEAHPIGNGPLWRILTELRAQGLIVKGLTGYHWKQ